jgi:uncharacterized protein YozE (UPF0346 family)
MLWCSLYTWKFFLLKKKISNFSGISKFLELVESRQFWMVLGSFRQFWADFAALAMAESMPKL